MTKGIQLQSSKSRVKDGSDYKNFLPLSLASGGAIYVLNQEY